MSSIGFIDYQVQDPVNSQRGAKETEPANHAVKLSPGQYVIIGNRQLNCPLRSSATQ